MKRYRENIAVENQVQDRKSKSGETSLAILGKSKQRKIFHTSLTNAQFCVFVFVVSSYNCIYLAKISWESRTCKFISRLSHLFLAQVVKEIFSTK